MTMRIGTVLVLFTATTAFSSDKSSGLPVTPIVEGRVPSRLTQELNQPGPNAAPRLLPAAILDPKPRFGSEVAAIALADALIGMQMLSPIRLAGAIEVLVDARADFVAGERHHFGCKAAEARVSFQSVILKAPGSTLAMVAAQRLNAGRIPAAIIQSREPPLADDDEE